MTVLPGAKSRLHSRRSMEEEVAAGWEGILCRPRTMPIYRAQHHQKGDQRRHPDQAIRARRVLEMRHPGRRVFQTRHLPILPRLRLPGHHEQEHRVQRRSPAGCSRHCGRIPRSGRTLGRWLRRCVGSLSRQRRRQRHRYGQGLREQVQRRTSGGQAIRVGAM